MRKIESFKYKGTPEQMAKVAEYLLEQGAHWYDTDRKGKHIQYDEYPNDICYYEEGYAPNYLPPELELEIFGTTDGITGKPENEWVKNIGEFPMKHSSWKVDVKLRNGSIETNGLSNSLDWEIRNLSTDIIKWRYAEKSDEEYFVQPETTEKKLTMDEAMDLVIDWPKKGNVGGGPIKSDGGSSDYYKLTIKTKDGSFECETGDVIAAIVGDNFALGNALKALRRIWCAHEGRGKEGIDMAYDAKKIGYFVQDFIKRNEK